MALQLLGKIADIDVVGLLHPPHIEKMRNKKNVRLLRQLITSPKPTPLATDERSKKIVIDNWQSGAGEAAGKARPQHIGI
ncbi:hypothetical protein CO655_28505 [Rhizobium sp. M1]|nr:hypothetical protein CO655_28505 [Rhizobium sp. M1]